MFYGTSWGVNCYISIVTCDIIHVHQFNHLCYMDIFCSCATTDPQMQTHGCCWMVYRCPCISLSGKLSACCHMRVSLSLWRERCGLFVWVCFSASDVCCFVDASAIHQLLNEPFSRSCSSTPKCFSHRRTTKPLTATVLGPDSSHSPTQAVFCAVKLTRRLSD